MIFAQQESWLSKLFYNVQAWHSKFFIVNFFIAFTFVLLIWGEVVWAFFVIGDQEFLSLHYSIYFGVDWLGGISNFFIFPAISTGIFLINYILANLLYNKKKLLSYFLMIGTSILEILLIIAVGLIIYINWIVL